ncbi:MAG: immunoglobulin domain-containing protein [Verrucomicrobiota bacterium]
MPWKRIVRLLLPAALLPLAGRVACGQILISNYTSLTNALASSSCLTNFLSGSVITLAAGQTLQISNNVEIDGGTNGVVINGQRAARIIHVHPNCRLILNNLQLLNGIGINGGAVFNEGALIVSNSVLSGNAATNASGADGAADPGSGNGSDGGGGGGAAGGAIFSLGPVSLYYCVFGTNAVIAGAGGSGGAGTGTFVFSGNGGNGGNGGGAMGGAVFSSGNGNVFVATEFIGNECFAGSGGAGGAAGQGLYSSGNTGSGGFGGLARGGAVYVTTSLSMSGCLFYTNSVTAGASGPGQVFSDGTGSDGLAGGPAAGGGLYLDGGVTNAEIENTTFLNNSCAGGAGGAAAGQKARAGDGGPAAGGGLASAAVLAVARNCTLATNTLAGGAGGTASGVQGANGAAGQTSGWDICGSAGALRLANSILSGGATLTPNPSPNAAGVTDAGYNINSDGSLAAATSTTVAYTDPGLAPTLSSTNGGPALGPTNVAGFAMLTLAVLDGGPAAGAVAGVPGLSFPAFDARQMPRGTPASAGAFESSARLLTVKANIGPPSITSQPAGQISPLGLAVTFSVTATNHAGDPNALGYQWQLGGTNIYDNASFSGANRGALTVKTVNPADEGDYQVVVSPSLLDGAATSSVAVLALPIAPAIKVQPSAKLNRPEGGVVTFRVAATGGPPLFYQWRSNGVALTDGNEIHGAATSNLTLNPVAFRDEAGYSVVVSNFFRSVTSVVARLTVVADKTRPAVAITSPAPGARTTNSTVSGTASDNAQVTNVVCWVTNVFAGSNKPSGVNALLSTNGTTVKAWSVANALLPGTNIVAVQSVDYSGHVSPVVTRRIFRAVPSVFGLSIDGNGTVSGSASVAGNARPGSNALLNLGEGYTVSAKPDAGNLFVNWTSGAFTNASNPLHFVMASNLSLQAHFVTNPFIATAGIYSGLFFDATNGVTEQTAGMLSHLSVNSRGVYSGRLLLDGSAYALNGGFALSGSASNRIPRSAARGGPVTVQMMLQWTNDEITGTVSGTKEMEWTAALTAELAEASSSPAEYTMLLAPPANAAGIPPGFGYALLTNHDGHLTLSGRLADGAAFSQSVPISPSGYVPIYASLYGNAGLLLGWINLAGGAPQGETNLVWIKPAGRPGIYANGFTNSLSVQGSAWSAAAAFPLSAGTLAISNASLDLTYQVALSNNAVIAKSGPANSLRGAINPKTGALKVIFGNGEGNATTTGFGACLQDATNAGGFFVTKTNAGAISLEP